MTIHVIPIWPVIAGYITLAVALYGLATLYLRRTDKNQREQHRKQLTKKWERAKPYLPYFFITGFSFAAINDAIRLSTFSVVSGREFVTVGIIVALACGLYAVVRLELDRVWLSSLAITFIVLFVLILNFSASSDFRVMSESAQAYLMGIAPLLAVFVLHPAFTPVQLRDR